MTPPRPAGDGERRPICLSCGRWDTEDGHHPRCAERPASPPAGAEADEELREALAQALHQARCGPKCSVRPSDQNERDADALLSGPLAALVRERDELRAKVAAAEEAVRRVRKLADRLKRGGQHVPEVDLIYRALDG